LIIGFDVAQNESERGCSEMPRNRIQLLGAVGLVAAFGLAATSGATSAPATRSSSAADFAQAKSKIASVDKGSFLVACNFSHRNQDDPIVFPRQPGRSHDHTYFGNRSTNAFSTALSLRKHRRTTCRGTSDANRSAYWVPTLFVGGRAIKPVGMLARYVRRTYARVDPFPAGLKMIAGDAHARAPQPNRITSWMCGNPINWLEPHVGFDPVKAGSKRVARIPVCDTGLENLRLEVNFPNCWDGTRLDSPNHKSHVAYSSKGACPRSHRVEVPGLTLWVEYPVSGGRSAELASGGQFSGHADFVNGWNQVKFRARVNGHLNHLFRRRP
jgi:hypothetical protein